MRNTLIGLLLVLSACSTKQQVVVYSHQQQPFVAKDLTATNIFSKNIEGPSYRNDSLFVVNYRHDGTIAYIDTSGKVHLYVNLPDSSVANSIKFDSDGNMLLADFIGHNILKVDASKNVSVYCHNDHFNQPNDICINKSGQLFASDPNWADSTGQLWRIDKGGKAVLLAANMGTTNGITLSPDERTLYVNESDQLKIWKFDVDIKGNISNKTLFTTFPDYGLDGMKCDKDGNLYVCRHGKGVIAVFSPQAKLLREIPLKGKLCSNLVFGGHDGKTVFVTLQDRKCMEMFRSNIGRKGY